MVLLETIAADCKLFISKIITGAKITCHSFIDHEILVIEIKSVTNSSDKHIRTSNDIIKNAMYICIYLEKKYHPVDLK